MGAFRTMDPRPYRCPYSVRNVVDERVDCCIVNGSVRERDGDLPDLSLEAQVGLEVDAAVSFGDAVGGQVVENAFAELGDLLLDEERIDGELAEDGFEPFAPHVGGCRAKRREDRRQLRDEDPR